MSYDQDYVTYNSPGYRHRPMKECKMEGWATEVCTGVDMALLCRQERCISSFS